MLAKTSRLSLRALLTVDALTCTAMGFLLVTAATRVEDLTNITEAVLFWAGLALLPVAAFMAFCARLVPVPTWAATIVIYGNCGWIAVSLALPIIGLISPNPFGWLFLIAQAAAVAFLTWLESAASRREAARA